MTRPGLKLCEGTAKEPERLLRPGVGVAGRGGFYIKARGKCPECGRNISLKKDGTMFPHVHHLWTRIDGEGDR